MGNFQSNMNSSIEFDEWQNAIIELKEIKKVLNYQDIRSVCNWCKKNNVFVLSQGNTQVVNLIEFILAFYKPYIDHLRKTEANWKTLFLKNIKANLDEILDDKDELKSSQNNYKPKSNLEKSFLKKLKEL